LWVTAAALPLAGACTHLTKIPVQEVPIDQFQATPAEVPAASAGVPPIVDEGPTAATTTAAATTTGGAKPAGSAPTAIEPPDPAQERIDAAMKLARSGKKADLQMARKMLIVDVGSGNGTPGEARALKQICTKLGDKACVAKASSYIK